MRKIYKSLGFALAGLIHATIEERNIRLFFGGEFVAIVILTRVQASMMGWIFVLLTGALFLITELLNTALERLADTLHDCEKCNHGTHYHVGIKHTKDVGAAASLIALTLHSVIILGIILTTNIAS